MSDASTMTQPQVLVVGVGQMGRAMTLNLLDKGFSVAVADVDPLAIAFFDRYHPDVHKSIDFNATKCAVIVCVVDATQLHAVLFEPPSLPHQLHHGLAHVLKPGSTVVITSTIAPADVRSAARRLGEHGLHTLDAPISGGPARARAGTMSLMVSGDEAVIQSNAVLLDAISNRIQPMGSELGSASIAKLINNALATVHWYNHCQAMLAAAALGLDCAGTNTLVAASSGQSWMGAERMARFLANQREPKARMALLAKDSALALRLLHDNGLPSAWLAPAAKAFADACAAGFSQCDDSELITYLQQLGNRNGV